MLLDLVAIDERFKGLAPEYAAADPFPHVVLRDLVDASVLAAVLDEFPSTDVMELNRVNAHEVKRAESRWSMLGPTTRSLVSELMTGEFLDSLSKLTGISGLIADTRLRGGGLHMITQGGKLDVHADFNIDAKSGLHRRLNLLIYLNPNWNPDWNGQLELWPEDMSTCRQRVNPDFGTSVIFSTTSSSFHGHPTPLTCPPDVARRSLALYYYTVPDTRGSAPPTPHSTLFRARPGTDDVPESYAPTAPAAPATPEVVAPARSATGRSLTASARAVAALPRRVVRRLRREFSKAQRRGR